MRQNVTHMDFRTIPSTIPLHSPSPDTKSPNCLTPTISPNTLHIKKNLTPIKHIHSSKENANRYESLNLTNTNQPESYRKNGQYVDRMLNQKDELIKNLKNMINMITDNNKRNHKDVSAELEGEVKVLTIENQKLVEIVEKLTEENQELRKNEKSGSLDENWEEEMTIKFENYEKQIQQLNETMKVREKKFQAKMEEIRKENKSLTFHLNALESTKKQLQAENQRFIKILKEKNQSSSRIQFLKNSDVNEESESVKSTKSYEKLTLLKIKEQYHQNVRGLREELGKEIEETFQIMKMNLNSIDIKVNGMVKRLESIQKIVFNKYKNYEVSPLRQPKTKSQIYIEEAPESSSSRQQISKALETQHKDKNELEQQITKLRSQLEEVRFKYEKVCMDNSTVTYSKRNLPTTRKQEDYQELQSKYFESAREVETKDKEINILYEQIRAIESEKLEQMDRGQQQLQLYKRLVKEKEEELAKCQEEISLMASKSSEELLKTKQLTEQSVKQETQFQIKSLITNYDKELQLLNKQITTKNKLIEDYIAKISLIQSQQMEREQIVTRLSKNTEELQQKLRENFYKLQYLKQQNSRIDQQNTHFIIENKQLNSSLELKDQKIEAITRQLQSQNTALAQKLEQKSKENEGLSQFIKKLSENYQINSSELKKIKDLALAINLSSKIMEFSNEDPIPVLSQEEERIILQQEVKSKTIENIELQSRMEAADRLREYYQKQAETLGENLRNLQVQLTICKNRNDSNESVIRGNQAKIRQLVNQIQRTETAQSMMIKSIIHSQVDPKQQVSEVQSIIQKLDSKQFDSSDILNSSELVSHEKIPSENP